MKKILAILTGLMLLSLAFGTRVIAAPREMSDSEMDLVTGGDAPVLDPSDEQNALADPSLTINSSSINNSINTITISDQAQQNLTSMVNLISINSSVAMMFNINVSINSTVGSVTQGNLGLQSSTQTAIVP